MNGSAKALASWNLRRKTVYDRETNRLFHNGFGWERKLAGWHPLGVAPLEAPPELLERVKKHAGIVSAASGGSRNTPEVSHRGHLGPTPASLPVGNLNTSGASKGCGGPTQRSES